MSYQYPATPEERAAAALLREKGWGVSEPTCPDCHGWGFVSEGESWGEGPTAGASWSTKPCPRGCAPVSWFFTSGTNAGTSGWIS